MLFLLLGGSFLFKVLNYLIVIVPCYFPQQLITQMENVYNFIKFHNFSGLYGTQIFPRVESYHIYCVPAFAASVILCHLVSTAFRSRSVVLIGHAVSSGEFLFGQEIHI